MNNASLTFSPGLLCDIDAGESLTIKPSQQGQEVQVHVVEKSGRKVRLRIQSSEFVRVEKKTTKTA